MTNEKLIEEAAKAIDPGAWWTGAYDPRWVGETEHRRISARRQATSALAVFEKALGEATVTPTTPPDDEREALARIVQDVFLLNYDAARRCADEMISTPTWPFRRSEVPEPSARCPKCGVSVTDQTPSTFYTHHDETCGGPLEEPQDSAVTLTPEAVEANREYIERTQDEPSDAQVQGLIGRAQSIVDQMKSSAGRRTRGDEWCYVRFGQVHALGEVLRVMGRVVAQSESAVESGADELWRRVTQVGTKPGPTMSECRDIMRTALRAAGGATHG